EGLRAVPAAGDRLRPLSAPGDARRARRPGAGDRQLRARFPHHSAPRRAGAGPRGKHLDRGDVVMSEAMDDTLVEEPSEELTFPATLPVLPLKDTVVFPESVTPLAIGQERSI